MEKDVLIRLFEYIENKGLSQSEFGNLIGVSRAIISNWKTGKHEPEDKRIFDIIRNIPDIDANWLIRGHPLSSVTNTMIGSHNMNQQGDHNTAQDSSQAYLWKERYEAAERIIAEKEKYIELLKSMKNL